MFFEDLRSCEVVCPSDDDLPKEKRSSREWVLEWHNKTEESAELYEYRQRSSSHGSSESPSCSMASIHRSSSVPTKSEFDNSEIENMDDDISGGGGLLSIARQTLGESSSVDGCLFGKPNKVFVSNTVELSVLFSCLMNSFIHLVIYSFIH